MSNVLRFPNKVYSRELKRKQLAEQIERSREQGGQAIKSLTSWRRNIPMVDRERLARNMNAILEEYRIVPSRLNWQQDYVTAEEFRRDLHRMRLPETASPGRRLIATPAKWSRLLGYVAGYLQANGESISLEFLADRLIRGTRFHPTKKEQTDDEKLLYLLGLWANQLSEKYGLLATYRKIARARAEYHRSYQRAIDSAGDWSVYEPNFYSSLRDDFRELPDEVDELFDKPFLEYSPDDWEALYAVMPEGVENRYRIIQGEIADWKNTYSEEGTLHYTYREFPAGFPVLSWGEAIPFLPHWFLGYVDVDETNVMTNRPDYWVADLIRQQGTLDPLSLGKEIDWNSCAAYLVLYPDQGMNRVLPWLYCLTEEFSTFAPVDQSYDLEGSKYFQPRDVNVTTVSRTLLRRVEESREEISRSWDTTSCTLESHPYLVWMNERKADLDKEIEAVLMRTGRIGADDEHH